LKFTHEPIAANAVRKIEPGAITIGAKVYTNNIGLFADAIIEKWPECPIHELTEAYLAPILEKSPEMLILGSGWQTSFAPRELLFALARRGIGLEVMDTPAACRTFNILVSEDRRPAAILYLQE